jgi:hypothetical protein
MDRYIKAWKLRCIGHVVRMDKERTVKRVTDWRPIAVIRFGRPRLRSGEDIRADIGKMKIQNWSKMAMDREGW